MKGTHGTCRSRATSINKDGFKVSPSGKRGAGVYFWGYTKNSLESYAKKLAVHWCFFAKNKAGTYNKDSDKRCSVIIVSFNIQDERILDLENQTIRDSLIEYTNKVYSRIEGDDDDKISVIYDMFVKDLEIETNVEFKLIHVKIQQPRGFKKDLPLDITGQPSCYVVKDPACITIEYIEEIDDE